MEIILIAILIGLLPGYIAYRKGKNFFIYWLFGAALFIVALPWTLLMKPKTEMLEKRALKNGTMKKCKFCAELIKVEAGICKYCGKELQEKPDNR